MSELESQSSLTMAEVAEIFQQLKEKFDTLQEDVNAIKSSRSGRHKHKKSCCHHWRRCRSSSGSLSSSSRGRAMNRSQSRTDQGVVQATVHLPMLHMKYSLGYMYLGNNYIDFDAKIDCGN